VGIFKKIGLTNWKLVKVLISFGLARLIVRVLRKAFEVYHAHKLHQMTLVLNRSADKRQSRPIIFVITFSSSLIPLIEVINALFTNERKLWDTKCALGV
jgi:hypothetical protein